MYADGAQLCSRRGGRPVERSSTSRLPAFLKVMSSSRVIAVLLMFTSQAISQDIPGRKIPSVTMSPAPITTVTRGKPCDNAACYPPKKLPVEFEVKVVKGPPPHRRNPAQSPHVHG